MLVENGANIKDDKTLMKVFSSVMSSRNWLQIYFDFETLCFVRLIKLIVLGNFIGNENLIKLVLNKHSSSIGVVRDDQGNTPFSYAAISGGWK